MEELPEPKPPESSLRRIIAGGLFSLFCAFIFAALAVFGIISVTLGHILMALAAAIGGILIWTELIPSKPPKHKLLATLLLVGLIGGADYLIVRYKSAESAHATATAPMAAYLALDHKDGEEIDGIKWDARFHDVRISIDKTTGYPIQSIDLSVDGKEKGAIDLFAGIGQSSPACPGLKDNPIHLPPDHYFRFHKDNGQDVNESTGDLADRHGGYPFMPGWHVFCPALPSETTLKLVVAAVHLGDNMAPNNLHIFGSYTITTSDGIKAVKIDDALEVRH